MAILAPFRAPQPQAYYLNPATVSKDGLFHGWAVPFNSQPAGVSFVYFTKQFAAGAFKAPNRPVGANTFVLPARWGRLRGILPYNTAPGP